MPTSDAGQVPYSVFTTQFDETLHAHELAARPSKAGPATSEDDRREGILPTAESDAAAIAAGLPEFDGTIQILLDMSGSNRGTHIETIRLVDVTARALEKAGIPFEVLGYTTTTWKGGQSRELWKVPPFDGRVSPPGRLCDLLHVVFKETDKGWDDASDGKPSPAALLDVLFRPPYLKENVDGEAIRWAMSRHPEGDVRMIYFNDGASVDDSTSSVNAAPILAEDRVRAMGELASAGIEPTVVQVLYSATQSAPDGIVGIQRVVAPSTAAVTILERALAPAPSASPGL